MQDINLPWLRHATHLKPGTVRGAWLFVSILCVCNVFNFVDRSAISGMLPALDAEWGDTHAFDGALSSVFMASYGVASVGFAAVSSRVSPFLLLLVGMVAWVGAALAAGLAVSPTMLLVARAFSGTAEATLQTVGPPMMQNIAERFDMLHFVPWWLGWFSMMMNVGLALGTPVAGQLGPDWRDLFLAEALAMGPICIAFLALLAHDRRVRSSSAINEALLRDGGSLGRLPSVDEVEQAWSRTAWSVLTNRVWLLTTLGYAAQLACQNGAAFWIPKFVLETAERRETPAEVTRMMGLVGLGAGIGGTLIGMYLSSLHPREHVAKTRFQFRLMLLAMAFGLGFLATSLTMRHAELGQLACALALAFCFFYATTVPNMILYLEVVQRHERAFSMALGILIPHLLGDALSTTVSGWVWDEWGPRTAMWFLCAWGLLSLPLWLWARSLVVRE